MPFTDPEVRLDVDDNLGLEASRPATLQILVSDARQIFPTPSDVAQSVLFFGGTARFSQDGGAGEDLTNEPGEEKEVDGDTDGGGPRTLKLALEVAPSLPDNPPAMVGSASFAALGNIGLTTFGTDIDPAAFGVATNNALTLLTGVPNSAGDPTNDAWFFADVSAEEGSQLNRLGYQAAALLQTNSLLSPKSRRTTEKSHHGQDFLVDLDVNAPNQVQSARALKIAIKDGQQVFASDNRKAVNGANLLLIFTGTAVCSVEDLDRSLKSGVVRVRLAFPAPGSLIVKGAASVAALAGFHANSQGGVDATMYAVNSAKIVTQPGDNDSSVPNPRGLPDGELYLLMDATVLGNEDNGHGAIVSRIAYQANVLVQDTEPDLDSLLLSLGEGEFVPALSVSVTGGSGFLLFDLKVTLTGPVPQGNNPFFGVILESDHLQDVPVAQLLVVNQGDFSALLPNNMILETAPDEVVTITATNPKTNTKRTATITISRNK